MTMQIQQKAMKAEASRSADWQAGNQDTLQCARQRLPSLSGVSSLLLHSTESFSLYVLIHSKPQMNADRRRSARSDTGLEAMPVAFTA